MLTLLAQRSVVLGHPVLNQPGLEDPGQYAEPDGEVVEDDTCECSLTAAISSLSRSNMLLSCPKHNTKRNDLFIPCG